VNAIEGCSCPCEPYSKMGKSSPKYIARLSPTRAMGPARGRVPAAGGRLRHAHAPRVGEIPDTACAPLSSLVSIICVKKEDVEGWGDGVGEGDKWQVRVGLRMVGPGRGGAANSLVRYVYGVTERHPLALQYILGISRLPTRATVHGARTSTALFKRGKPLRASSMQSGGVRRWRGAHQRPRPRALFVRRPRRPRPARAGFWGGLKL